MILLNKHFKKNLEVFRMYIFWEIIQTKDEENKKLKKEIEELKQQISNQG